MHAQGRPDRDALIKDAYKDTATAPYSIIPAGLAGHTTSFFDTYGAHPSQPKAQAALEADGTTDKVKPTSGTHAEGAPVSLSSRSRCNTPVQGMRWTSRFVRSGRLKGL
nr:hypothetical protein OG999_42440 [Streptomyces sp. NBC_00886]